MVRKKNAALAIFMVVLLMIAIMPVATQEAYADIPADFIQHVKGLKDGKLVRGSTISIDINEVLEANEAMMESYLNYGEVGASLRIFSPADMLDFDYNSDSMIATLKVPEDKADAGYKVEVLIFFGGSSGDVYYDPSIEVIDKSANTLSVKGRTAKVKYSKLKKKAQYLAVSKVISFVNKGQGAKKYSLVSAKKSGKSYKKYFKVASSTGKVTVKKGLKKGTYTVKVKVKASGTDYYKASAYKTATIKIKVK